MNQPKTRGRRWRRIAVSLAGVMLLLGVAAFVIAYVRSDNECGADRAAPATGMRAVIYCEYGPPDVLKVELIEKPVPADSQVLVRVHAASVNPLDWHYLRGTPRIARFGMGLRKPAVIRMGVDFAGTVEAVGARVTRFKPGDEVFGARTGAFAEYVTVWERRVARKPSNVSFEQAAAVPVAAITALQALRDQGKVRPGQKVLINGASGGVGTFAVQIAKTLGVEVTGVSSTRNNELVRSIGADHVIDYTKEDFTQSDQRYDVIIDNVGNHSLKDLRRVLTPNGTYVMVGGPSGGWIDPFPRVISMMATSRFVDQELRFFISEVTPQDLDLLRDLIQSGQVIPVIDRRYRLEDIAQAVAYLETGRARGKVVVAVN